MCAYVVCMQVSDESSRGISFTRTRGVGCCKSLDAGSGNQVPRSSKCCIPPLNSLASTNFPWRCEGQSISQVAFILTGICWQIPCTLLCSPAHIRSFPCAFGLGIMGFICFFVFRCCCLFPYPLGAARSHVPSVSQLAFLPLLECQGCSEAILRMFYRSASGGLTLSAECGVVLLLEGFRKTCLPVPYMLAYRIVFDHFTEYHDLAFLWVAPPIWWVLSLKGGSCRRPNLNRRSDEWTCGLVLAKVRYMLYHCVR